ncbi:MAG: diguanylate cyclase [Lachnospiraceae bacterium]|nr:diguanylate cyclase [Lachnospiraceae bacterium]
MNRNPFKWLAMGLLVISVLSSTVAYLLWGVDRDKEKKENLLIAEMVDNKVIQELSTAISVSKMISQDTALRDNLEKELRYSEDGMVLIMRKYLNSIQKEFGFNSVYVVSEKSKRYYTYVGLNKVIDPENDNFDTWYTDFLSHGSDYELESSTDEVNRDRLTIFVDGRVEDENGELLGVSGVGVETEGILNILNTYENEYGVRIDYVDSNGMVQMSSRVSAVNSSYVSGVTFTDVTDEEYSYQENGVDGFAIVKYVPEFGWYMVIRSESAQGAFSYDYRFFFAEALILIMTIAILVNGARSLKVESGNTLDRDKTVDRLTGLQNRDYFLRIYGDKGTLNTTQYQSIAEFSIDDYENVSKKAGSERVILDVVRTAREAFGLKGQIMRWHSNSFVVLLEMPIDEAEAACRHFCKAVADIGVVTVSVGLTQIELNETLKKNYYRAVQNLYLVKELGGNNVKRG